MKRILISGETSFIGASFRRYSTFVDVKVVSLRSMKIEEIDFSDIDVVIHLAAIVHSSKKISLSEYLRINCDLAFDFASAAKSAGVKQFIFLSTTKVYGVYEPGNVWNEVTNCKPTDNYGISKYRAEQMIRTLDSSSFIVSIVRTPVVYGPENKANMSKIVDMVRYMPIIPLGNTANQRHFDYIENLISLIDRIIEKNMPGIFISMDDGAVSTSELVRYIADSLNRRVLLVTLPMFLRRCASKFLPFFYERLFGSFILDNSLTKKRLYFSDFCTTREGIYRSLKADAKATY